MSVTVDVQGLKELERSMEDMSTRMGRAVLTRSLKKASQPLADLMSDLAPDDPNTPTDDLEQSITVTTRATRQVRSSMAKFSRITGLKNAATVFVGPDAKNFYGVFPEFGTIKQAPQPFMRPAWEQDQDALLGRVKEHLAEEIDRAVKRLAAKG